MSYDVNNIRKQFPMLNGKIMQGKKLVFLDNASTTFKPNCVIDAINSYYKDMTSNSHRGDYDLCYNMDKIVDEARVCIANFINCNSNEVVFTSGTTMSINLLAYSYGEKFLSEGDEIVLDEAEHASNVLPWFAIAKKKKAKICFVELNDKGEITIENLKKVLNKNTKIVALAACSNVLGTYVDLEAFAQEIHKFDAVFAVDGAQSVPHIKTDFKNSGIDFLSFSAHKMCGPTGIGALVGRKELLDKMDPLFMGGGMNVTFDTNLNVIPLETPTKFEAGTLNLEGIIGFKAAVEFISSIGIENIHDHDVELHKYLVQSLSDNENIIIYNKDIDTSTFVFNRKDVFAQDEATLLNSKGIAVRSGKHCAKMLNTFLQCVATVRASTYLYTSKEEIDEFIDALKNGGDILDAYFN